MKGVIYARYSSDNQREESIEGQIRECKAFMLFSESILIILYRAFPEKQHTGVLYEINFQLFSRVRYRYPHQTVQIRTQGRLAKGSDLSFISTAI